MKTICLAVGTAALLLILPVPARSQSHRTESFRGRDVLAGEVIVRFRPTAAAAREAVIQDTDTSSTAPIGNLGTMIVRSRSRSTEELIQAFSGRQDVQYVEPNYIWHKSDVPSDTLFVQQWGLQNTGQTILGQAGTPNSDIHVVPAWDTTLGSRNVVVGVIDTGIAYTHGDLIDNVWTAPVAFSVTINGQVINCSAGSHGFNAIQRTCDPKDDEGHGTAVSGIIGANGTNGFGVSGVSRISSLMGLKFLDSTGSGTTEDAIAAIEFAIQVQSVLGINIRVLNASWGSNGFSQALLDEINSANDHNMLFVTAAGNESENNDVVPSYPANFNAPNIISVAATDNRDELAGFSNFGAGTVHLGAPGVGIQSTDLHISYDSFIGTSAATPMVSGAAALLLSSCPANTSTLKSMIVNNVDRVPSLSGKTVSGGRLNVASAMIACPGSIGTFELSTNQQSLVGFPITSVLVTVTGSGGFAGDVTLSVPKLPSGITASFNPPHIIGSGSSTMTLTVSIIVNGPVPLQLFATDGMITKTLGLSVVVPLSLNPNDAQNFALGAIGLQSSPERPGTKADFYRITLSSPTVLTLDMRSLKFDPFLYLFSASGVLMNTDDNGGGGIQARIGPISLPAGKYVVEATAVTAGASGNYYIGLNCPVLDSISPTTIQAGTTANLTLKGNGFTPQTQLYGLTVGFPANLTFVDSQTLTASIPIDATLPPLVYDAFVSNQNTVFGFSNRLPVTVTLAAPVLTSIVPDAAAPGTTIDVRLNGSGFSPTMTVNAGPGITATLVAGNLFRFVIAPTATPGDRDLTFSTSVGTSNAVKFTVAKDPPTLITANPSSGNAGKAVNIFLTGTNFIPGMTFNFGGGTGNTLSVSLLSSTLAQVFFLIDSNTALGPRNISVLTSLGQSNPITFTVKPAVPVIGAIDPVIVPQGSTRDLIIKGSGFSAPMTLDAGSGITVSNLTVVDSSNAVATIAIASNAPTGIRSLTVTDDGGTSNTVQFTVAVPFPDLWLTEQRNGSFGSGYLESYTVLIRNVGNLPTTGTTTLTYNFNSSLPSSSVVGSGSGWNCSTISAKVTCLLPTPLIAGAQSTITFSVFLGSFTNSTLSSTFFVSTANDLNTANDGASEFTPVALLPKPTVSSPPMNKSASQIGLSLNMGNLPFPHALSGTLRLTFVPSSTALVDDPAIQFSTGGRTVSFTVPENSKQIIFGSDGIVGLQSGTVAGSITISGTLDVPAPMGPQTISPVTYTILPSAPVITSISKDTQSGLTAVINMYSNTRDVTSVSLTFNTKPEVSLGCGGVSGCSAAGNTISFDVRTLFADWYSGNPTFGTADVLRIPFSVSGALSGIVSVTIKNSAGSSFPGSIPLP